MPQVSFVPNLDGTILAVGSVHGIMAMGAFDFDTIIKLGICYYYCSVNYWTIILHHRAFVTTTNSFYADPAGQ